MSLQASVFKYLDYRSYLKHQIANHSNEYGYKAKTAAAAGCQRSYLSQVLAERADLMPEHALGLAEMWALSPAETDHFMNLVAYARAADKKLRAHIREKIESARRDQDNLVKRITDKTVLPESSAAVFYSNWQYLAINLLLTIPEFRNVAAIANRLSLNEEVTRKLLTQLESLGLVTATNGAWTPTNSTIHVPRDSQFNSLNHSHWRNKAVENSMLALSESVHYTSVCTLSLEDAEKIKDLALRLVDDSRRIVKPSKEEELYCLTVDWFKI